MSAAPVVAVTVALVGMEAMMVSILLVALCSGCAVVFNIVGGGTGAYGSVDRRVCVGALRCRRCC